MLERLLDIAVYALMAALVAVGVSKILDQRRDAQTVAWTEAIPRAMDRLAGTSMGYAPQGSAGTNMTAALLSSNLLPAAMIDHNSGSTAVLRNAYGGAITVTATSANYTIAQDTLPPGACVALTLRARDWAEQICVNGGIGSASCLSGATVDTAWASTNCTRTAAPMNSIAIRIVP